MNKHKNEKKKNQIKMLSDMWQNDRGLSSIDHDLSHAHTRSSGHGLYLGPRPVLSPILDLDL